VEESYGKLPLSFEPNEGQASRTVGFLSRGENYSLFLSATQAELALHQENQDERLQMKLVGSNRNAKLSGESQLEGRSNYLVGAKVNWHTDIPNFAKVRATDVYKGIDAIYYGTDQQRLEFDFVVSPGSDPSLVRLKFAGAQSVTLAANGDLKIKMAQSEITQPAPVVYQDVRGQRCSIASSFVLAGDGEVGFKIGDYDPKVTLVIDPKIIYGSHHGGTGNDQVRGLAVDKNGNAFLVGSTTSTNLNVTGGLQSTNRGIEDGFIVKINPSGSQRLFSTYIGSSGADQAESIALTTDGRACITGTADSEAEGEFPTTSSRYQGPNRFFTHRGNDAFVAMLNLEGSGLLYSSFLGGNDSDSGDGIAVDASNNIYVTGSGLSSNFPTKNAFQTQGFAFSSFIAKFNPAESGNDSLVYSSLIGGTNNRSEAAAIAVTPNGVAFVTGQTLASDFPTRSASSLPPLQTSLKGERDGFVVKISTTGSLIYSTYFGGDRVEAIKGIAVDSNERVYLAGVTTSGPETFPLRNAFDPTRGGFQDGFIAKLNADGTALFYSSYIGGEGNDAVDALTIDNAGNAYVGGFTLGDDLLEINGFNDDFRDDIGFLAKIEPSNATGTNVPGILYLGRLPTPAPVSMAIDPKGNVYLGGSISTQFPRAITAGRFQPAFNGGGSDGFILKISATLPDTIGVYRPSTKQFLLRNSNTPGAPDITKTFGVAGDIPVTGDWNGDGETDIGVFRPSTHEFLLRIPAFLTINTVVMNFGLTGDQPVVGDWNNDGIDTPGVFRPSTGEWFLTDGPNVNSSPVATDSFSFGQAGDLAIAGDFDGDGEYGVGVFRPSTGEFFLDDKKLNSLASATFNFGQNGDLPVAGDWRGDGADGVGVFRPSTGQFFLNDTNVTNATSLIVSFGQAGDQPVSGVWDTTP
jgi:hypothetical protein